MFNMSGDALLNLLRRARDIHIHLLETPNLVVPPIRQVPHRAHHPRPRREQEQPRVLPALRYGHEPDLEVERDAVLAFCLPDAQARRELRADAGRGPADEASVELHAEVPSAVDGGREGLCHSVRGE